MAGMTMCFVVEVELTHTTGKFASKDELLEAIKTELENANPGSVDGDNGGEYEVANWFVDEHEEPRPGGAAAGGGLGPQPMLVGGHGGGALV